MIKIMHNGKIENVYNFRVPGLSIISNTNDYTIILSAHNEYLSIEQFVIENLISKEGITSEERNSLEKLSIHDAEFWEKINVLFENNNFLKNTKIYIEKNSLLYIEESKRIRNCTLILKENSVLSIGWNTMINGRSEIYVGENNFCLIGADSLLAGGLRIRTNDGHTLISNENDQITNNYKNGVIIGDHVWVGENCNINKNTFVGSESIVASNSLLQNKVYPSYCLLGGAPAKLIKRDISFDSRLSPSNSLLLSVKSKKENCYKYIMYENKFKQAQTSLIFTTFDVKIKFLFDLYKERHISRFYVIDFNFIKNLAPIDVKKYDKLIDVLSDSEFVEKNKFDLISMFIENQYIKRG